MAHCGLLAGRRPSSAVACTQTNNHASLHADEQPPQLMGTHATGHHILWLLRVVGLPLQPRHTGLQLNHPGPGGLAAQEGQNNLAQSACNPGSPGTLVCRVLGHPGQGPRCKAAMNGRTSVQAAPNWTVPQQAEVQGWPAAATRPTGCAWPWNPTAERDPAAQPKQALRHNPILIVTGSRPSRQQQILQQATHRGPSCTAPPLLISAGPP